MTNLWDEMVAELAAHSIRVRGSEVTIIGHAGPSAAKTMPFEMAAEHLRGIARENATFLSNLWRQAADLLSRRGRFASSEKTQAMFVSAVKHLAKRASGSEALRSVGVADKFEQALREDIASFPQDAMSRMVDFRLAIDWIDHLVAYDAHRAELVETAAVVRESGKERTAQAISRDFSLPDGGAMPWWQFKDGIKTKHRAEPGSGSEDKTLLDRHNELRTEQGLEDQGDRGLLDEYDELAHGLRMRKRMKGTMLDIYDKNQKVIDYGSGEFGARSWNDTDNLGPHEQGLKSRR